MQASRNDLPKARTRSCSPDRKARRAHLCKVLGLPGVAGLAALVCAGMPAQTISPAAIAPHAAETGTPAGAAATAPTVSVSKVDVPLPVGAEAQNSSKGSGKAHPEGKVEGQVTDSTGALVPGARVELEMVGSGTGRVLISGKEGQFDFVGLPAGRYALKVSALGFEPYVSEPLELEAGEERRLPDVALVIPSNHADAYVTMNRKEIAAAEVHAAEQQRIIGFPDFYTSFVWNAAPMDARQKLSLGLHATTDRMAFVTAGLVASAEQIKGTFPGYGDGAAGFGKRYGAAYADGFVGKFLGGAILPSVFRQDPRYFYMGENGTTKQRVRHAVLSAFVVRGDNGHSQLNYSHILGNAGAGALSTLYHPAADSAGKLALDNALLGTLGEAGVNVVRELFLKRFVRGGDVDADGMP